MKYIIYSAFIVLGFYFLRINVALGIVILFMISLFAYKKNTLKQFVLGVGVFVFCTVIAVIINFPREIESISSIGVVLEAKENYYIIRTIKGRFYVSSINNEFEYFDVLKIKGSAKTLSMHAIESNFDFAQYLNNQGVFNELRVSESSFMYKRIVRSKVLAQNICTGMNEEVCALTQNLILAKNEKSDITSFASVLGITYLFTVSGYNLSKLLSFTEVTYKYLGIKKHRKLLSYITLIPYGLLILHRFAVIRMFIIALFSYINNKTIKQRYLFVLFCSFIFFICLDFYLIYQIKFYLPYIMSFIFLLTKKHIKKNLLLNILQMIIVYIFISVFILNEYELSIISFALRIILMPILFAIMIIIFLSIINVLPPSIITSLVIMLNAIFKALATIDLKIIIGKNDVFLTVILVLVFICYLISISIKDNNITRNVVLSTVCVLMFRSLGVTNNFKEAVYFIDVGQGDSILIQKNNTSVLIDTGGSLYKDIATTSLIPLFKKHRISDLDAIILSHNDFDHTGALPSLISNFKTKRILKNKGDFPFIIDGLHFINLNDGVYNDENSNSLIIYLEFMEKQWLFMGDASKEIELNVLKKYPELDVDYIKIGHHGSNTSSDKAFLRSITPVEAIISAGYLNFYGHPHNEVLSVLASLDIKIRRTDLEGTIVYQKYSF